MAVMGEKLFGQRKAWSESGRSICHDSEEGFLCHRWPSSSVVNEEVRWLTATATGCQQYSSD